MERSEIDAAWAQVRSRWGDEAAHRAFLDRHADLAGLAEAGRRYKAALDAAPADPVAARWRDEIVKRATVLAMSQLPRTRPPRGNLSPGARRLLLFALASGTVSAVIWAVLRFSRVVSGAAP